MSTIYDEPRLRGLFRFWPSDRGGMEAPVWAWPLRPAIRFAETGDLWFGIVLFQGEQEVVRPGDQAELEFVVVNNVDAAHLLRAGQPFTFGRGREFGDGVILAGPTQPPAGTAITCG